MMVKKIDIFKTILVILKPFNMNIIINKLDLPCDLKNEICKYSYNSEGYTVDDLNAIKKLGISIHHRKSFAPIKK